MTRRKLWLIVVVFLVLSFIWEINISESVTAADLPSELGFASLDKCKKPTINIIEKDRLLICVYPPDELDGKYIIRPRCDNLNLTLKCDKLTFAMTYSLFGPIVIGCPDRDQKFTPVEIFTDVIKASKNIPLCVPCAVSDFYLLTPKSENTQCTISGRYSTKGIIDPALRAWENKFPGKEYQPDPKYKPGPDDYCFDSKGLIQLQEVDIKLPELKTLVVFDPKSGKPSLVPVR
jgi:hypothetical protein